MNPNYSNLIFIAAMIAVFYFLMIRPQQQRARRQTEMIAALVPGDEIVTVGGIFAVVVAVGDRLRVRIADGSELEIAKAAVSSVVNGTDDGSASEAEPQEHENENEDSDSPAE